MDRPSQGEQAPASQASEQGEVAFRLASVRVAIAFTIFGALGSEGYALATWDQPHRDLLTAMAILALVTVPVVLLLPLKRIIRSRWREPFFYLYAVILIGVITAATAADGGSTSPYRILYVLPLIFAASSYPLGNTIAVGLSGLAAFAVVAATTSGAVRESVFVAFVLVCAVALGAWQARNRQRQSAELLGASRALRESEATARRREVQQREIAALGQRALAGARLDQLMDEAVSTAQRVLGAGIAGVLEFIPDRKEFLIHASVGFAESTAGVTVPAGRDSQAGYTLIADAPVIVEDWSREERFTKSEILDRVGAVCGVTVVIRGGNGPFGVLGVQSLEARRYGQDDVDFLQAIANVLANAVERRHEQEEARHRALHDALTGLPNRMLFEDHLSRALARQERSDAQVAVIFMDLDHFKLVNDALGHDAGDEVLKAVALRLKQALRSADDVARFSGDEFGVLLEDVTDERDATLVAERIASVLARPVVLAGREHFITASMGIAAGGFTDAPASLIRDADAAMYRAKERGRARYEIFDEAMRLRIAERLRIENELRSAVDRSELRLHYQPVVAVRSGKVTGAEALVRWDHPRHGLLYPDEFISVAEEGGLIVPIGRWVFEQACRQAAAWQAAAPDAAPLNVSVNVSASQLSDHDIVETVERLLESAGIEPISLGLEVTEGVLMNGAERPLQALRAFKELGLRLILDDFGIGRSSLGYLKQLPFDVIKLDRAFVANLGGGRVDDAIVSAVVALAATLDVSVVAEGVETEEQLEVIRELGCQYVQGNYVSPAVPAEQLAALLEAPARSA